MTWKKIVFFIACLAVLSATVAGLDLLGPVSVEDNPGDPAPRPVSVIVASLGRHAGYVEVFAEITARRRVDLKAEVSGAVIEVSPTARPGQRIAAGQLLMRLQPVRYRASLADARHALEQARLLLRQKRNKHDIALRNWQRAKPGIKPSSIAVHEPDVRVAERAVAAAEAKVAAAEHDLSATDIRAPFEGILTARPAVLGQSLEAGDVTVSLLDDTGLEIAASLSMAQWHGLAEPRQGAGAELWDEAGRKIGSARVRNGGGFLDRKSRRIRLFLDVVSGGDQGVLPGRFVRVVLPGREVDAALRLPESALSRDGFIWYVDEKRILRRFGAEPLFRAAGHIILQPPLELRDRGGWHIVLHPLSGYLPGQRVAPERVDTAEAG